MDFLFQFPTWFGICIVSLFTVAIGLLTVIISKKIIAKQLTKQHERIGRLLFRVTAGLIALLLSLSYANERIEQNKLRDSMELEASLIINVIIKLNINPSVQSERIKTKLVDYIKYTLNDDWVELKANPFHSKSSDAMVDALGMAYKLPENDSISSTIKMDVIKDINHITQLMQVRIYSQQTMTPYLIYILCFGMFFLWIFYSVYNLNGISLSFLSLYNVFVAVLIYFIFMMSNPLVGNLKMDHDSFEIIKSKGVDQAKK